MKTLADGTKVNSRSYYFLLDFNDSDGWKTLHKEFGVVKLYQLNITQYTKLFKIASGLEYEYLEEKIK